MHGVINSGKTNMHEFNLGTTSQNPYFGDAKCPFDVTRFAGGSSGGTAGSVSTGTIPFGLATDTMGSIRISAACNGVIGYRPTINRWPCDYGMKISNIRDSVGPIAASMQDIQTMDAIVTG